ncbi:high affinity cGMP-specific 3',5'-cyclic phosphodiesterase 9A-like isoform X2 [Hippocampus zosterae]|uniref:high affinity cGMP-specific 3',5'-cyclic phosphodiesterase 9A-like isoform X2 n=1 Tax=Hippocampus zosterae TaxID=109293 RepID=UPI00223D8ACF|nr:high affinity cGMP-specific 3',5'-cyclic phosphodiesterase 9A-like isoform X2 [Hippocampus zosterae]
MSQLRDLIFIPEACHVPSGPKMATKIIHFIVNGKVERAEFGADCTAEDVKDLFCAAAEASPHHILKLYKSNGSVVNISPMLESNSQDSYYQLEVVASELQSIAITTDVGNMEQRLCHLETKVQEEAGKTPEIISDLKSQVDSFKRKLEVCNPAQSLRLHVCIRAEMFAPCQSIKHLSWMGLFRDECPQQFSKFPLKAKVPQVNKDEEHREVRRRFLNMSSLQVIEEVREHLKTPTFDNWQWEEPEMLVLLQVMFTDLDLLTVFHFEVDILQNFLFEVYCHYNNIPFHNFQHCFCVTQMMYGLIWLTDLRNKLDPMDLLIMLTSALCHDLDHPGYSNVYQINAQTKLALRYNDISPLENHHCAVAFGILAKEESNILKHVTTEQYKHIRAGMIKCILATDMARHNEILNNFKSIQSVFDFRNRDHTEVLMKIMLKVSDISNEARPMAVAEPWLVCLLQEFFNQGDTEKLKGLPVTPFMDRDKVSKPSSQTSFIRFLLLPLFTELTKLFPCLEKHILEPVRRALEYYSDLERATQKEAAASKP